MKINIQAPVAHRIYKSADGKPHDTENEAKKANIILAGRKAILDGLPHGKLNLSPGEAAELVLNNSDLFRELITRFKRLG